MADIKSFNIFGASGSKNQGLEKIKQEAEAKKKVAVSPNIDSTISTDKKTQSVQNKNIKDVAGMNIKSGKKNIKGAGAPIRNFDRVFVASQPLKLSALLNNTSRTLTEKYMSEYTRDELLRKALNDYIKLNMTKEDKKALLNDVMKDLEFYREKNPTLPQVDEQGGIIKTIEEIEKETESQIKKSWGIVD